MQITVEEVERAIRRLKKRKAPGEDLLPNEVWKELDKDGHSQSWQWHWRSAGQQVGSQGHGEEQRSDGCTREGDPTSIRNYRPIALTDTIYKISI